MCDTAAWFLSRELFFFYLVRHSRITRNVHSSHQELCEAGWGHGEVDPRPEPERGRPVPAPQPGDQEEEEAFLEEEEQVRLDPLLPERHPGGGERDHSRYGTETNVRIMWISVIFLSICGLVYHFLSFDFCI